MRLTNQKKIQHLYWRAGFGLSPQELKQKGNRRIKEEARALIDNAKKGKSTTFNGFAAVNISNMNQMADKETAKKMRKESRKKVGQLSVDWIESMANSSTPLLERMMLFWHTHFACRIVFGQLAFNYLDAIRKHALGNFRDLVLAISKDPAMIRYLNNQQNKKQQPNENYARELMELFTLGHGNYTEQDIKAGARAFTGWSSSLKGEFVFRKKWHDYGQKTFMGTTGNFDGSDIVNIILARQECAEFIVTKIYRYFVNKNVNPNHIRTLTDIFYKSDYEISILMEAIFTSDWFYEPKNIGTKIKSPTDLLVGILKTYQVDFEDKSKVIFILRVLGQKLFDPPNVAGWAGGKQWIDNSTLLTRLNLASYIFQGVDMDLKAKDEFEAAKPLHRLKKIKASANSVTLVDAFRKQKPVELPIALANFLLQPTTKIEASLMTHFILDDHKEDLIKTIALRLMSMPEYQLC